MTNRTEILKQVLSANSSLFKTQGAIVSGWRYRNGKRYGPYFRLGWRDDGRQKSFHLGSEGYLVEFVRQYLSALREPRRRAQAVKRTICRLRAARRKALERVDQELFKIGRWFSRLRLQSTFHHASSFTFRSLTTSGLVPARFLVSCGSALRS
jgi:hypothetical protein